MMEDLDSLLADLGSGKSSSGSVKKQRPPSSRVDLEELENLMSDLAAPTPSKPAPAPVQPAPVVQMLPPREEPRPSSITTVSQSIEELDDLMASLNAPSRTTRRVSVKPTIEPMKQPEPAAPSLVHAPKQAPTKAPSMNGDFQASRATPELVTSTYVPPSANTNSQIHSAPSYREPVQVQSPHRDPTPVFSAPSPAYRDSIPSYKEPAPAPTRDSYDSFSSRDSQAQYSSMANHVSQPPQNKPDQLDDLLKNLTTSIDNVHSDSPMSRGTCAVCRSPIMGEIIQAIGKSYHPEHFSCGNCRRALGTRTFYENNGTPFCEDCYQAVHCPRCAHCDKPILDRCVTALGKKWHHDHFICTQCLKPFAGGNFFERDGRPYCEADFYAMYAPKCAQCGDPIRGDCINALGQQWHPDHFNCTYCQRAFHGGSFFEYGGKPYCETHYHQQTGSLCAGCGKSVSGRCINALDKKWHPEHFVCAFCMNPLAGGSFTEHNSKAYCRECHGKLFGGSL
eukprot:TRINITY_DN2003_c0_g1_i1.p1 TRINITY_DN2003_c0_g1~~TRINITY_DN2003_c0_g1_i1.p1  ORF type:complete len:507 (-),score=100.84 TRINITY_DN2003_c0_g1_i1:90-1610(-)